MKRPKESAILSLAVIRKANRTRPARYLFNERQQIFALRPDVKSSPEFSQKLKRALARNWPVKALLNSRQGLIEKIDEPSPKELEQFKRHKIPLDKPQPLRRVRVESLDPTKFNVVDWYLRCPIFRICTRIVPSYQKAKEIFDFCAKQSCHLPGPYNISPCIPFQYVGDGCYARAHKMRWIITQKYGYCCEKVFSFAVDNDDTLAVKADKWGGCCVEWWYHVAPLIRVRFRLGKFSLVLAMVIDPGMFNKPVLLTSWLSAQENTTCNPHARVSLYSIQPGSAYTPAFGSPAGTAFDTDPSYTATDLTLTGYHDWTICS
jgi:hypothetical protein